MLMPAGRPPGTGPGLRWSATAPSWRRDGQRSWPAQICVVIGWDVNRLNRRDRSVLGRRDPFLQLAHLGEQRRLVPDRRRHAAKKSRHLRARLRESEDVVNEEQDVFILGVTEILRDSQGAERDPEAGARRFGHLTINKRRPGFLLFLNIDDTALLHLDPQVVALAGTLANTAEHRDAAVLE